LAYLSQVLADTTLLGGGAIVLKDHYEAAETLETIAKEQITDLFLVEPQLFDLMDHADLAATDLSSLRTITHLGASAPPSLRSRARQKFGTRIVHAYGASEEGLVSVIAGRDVSLVTSDQAFSAGRILPHVDVRVRRTDGSAAAMGECGTIEVRSPAMAQGYRNRPDLEMTAFHDGWYRSGDFGRIDADNYLYILGRAVDIVFVDGRLISPTLIEDTLCRLPEVRYASVVVEHEEPRWIAVAVAFPDRQIDFDNCRRAVLADHGETVAAAFVLLVRGFVPLTPQGKPDREAIRSLGRELSA
jgi:acyl-CoA synthetase (AMP-forming)/AMP-acid ligase II